MDYDGFTSLENIVGKSDDLDNDRGRIVAFRFNPDGSLDLLEECDGYFRATLTAAEVAVLVDWLQNADTPATGEGDGGGLRFGAEGFATHREV